MPAHVISSEQQRDRMLHTPIPKLIVSLSIPTLASQLISVFYNTADTYFVSKLSTSASAVGWPYLLPAPEDITDTFGDTAFKNSSVEEFSLPW